MKGFCRLPCTKVTVQMVIEVTRFKLIVAMSDLEAVIINNNKSQLHCSTYLLTSLLTPPSPPAPPTTISMTFLY